MSRGITGSCHCGRITYRLTWPEPHGAIPARACTCTFCRKHGASWTSHPAARLDVRLPRKDFASGYHFGTETALFRICDSCGVPVLVTSLIDGRLYAVVNTNTIDAPAGLELQYTPVTFHDGTPSDRLARRARSWIADVALRGDDPAEA